MASFIIVLSICVDSFVAIYVSLIADHWPVLYISGLLLHLLKCSLHSATLPKYRKLLFSALISTTSVTVAATVGGVAIISCKEEKRRKNSTL
jgi:hypothetical protein